MSHIYTEVDRLLLNRWGHVMALLQAHRDIQPRIEQVIEATSSRLKPWAAAHGYEVSGTPREARFDLWLPTWADRKRGPKVRLTIGGFCPRGFRKVDEEHPYLWVHTDLENFKVKEPERVAFASRVRARLGMTAQEWVHHNTDDSWAPFGRYLESYDDAARAELVSSPDALYAFCTEQLPALLALGEPIGHELELLGR